MTAPLWIDCICIAAVPPVERLREWATYEQHVVLRFSPSVLVEPEGIAKPALVTRLATALPECSVFDSGGGQDREWITVKRVIPTEDVLAHLHEFLATMRLFRQIATTLAHRLAARLGVAPDRLLDRVVRDDEAVGPMDGEWVSRPHGMECRFENRVTGQVVEVKLRFGAEFGALDPYFFALFVKTTPGLERLAQLLRDDFHDMARVFDVLHAGGHFRAVDCESSSGWVVRE